MSKSECYCNYSHLFCVCPAVKGVDLVKEVKIDWNKPIEAWNGERSKPVRYVCDRVLANEGRTRLLLVMEDTGNENVWFSDDFGNVGSTTLWLVRNVKETKTVNVYRGTSGTFYPAMEGSAKDFEIQALNLVYELIYSHEFEV